MKALQKFQKAETFENKSFLSNTEKQKLGHSDSDSNYSITTLCRTDSKAQDYITIHIS